MFMAPPLSTTGHRGATGTGGPAPTVLHPGPPTQALVTGRGSMTSHASGEEPTTELDDLVRRARAGDADAMDDLLRSVRPRVLAVCRGVLPYADDAEDACQDALLNVARKLDSFDGRSKFTTWLHMVALNSARSTYRRLKNQAVSLDNLTLDRADPRTTSVIAGTRLDLLEALEVVESTHPQVIEPLVLRDVYGLSYEEIARLTASPVGTVKSRVHDARQLVRPLLRPRG